MKYLVHTFGFILALGVAGAALAQEDNVLVVDTLTNIPNLTDASSANNIPDFLQNLYRYGIGIAAILAVVMITYGGFQYMTSEIPGVKADKRERIVQAIFGLILVLLPFLVFSIINPQILDLDPGFERVRSEQNSVNIMNGGDYLERDRWETCRDFPENTVTLFGSTDASGGGIRIHAEEIAFRGECCSNQDTCEYIVEPARDAVEGEETSINEHKCACSSGEDGESGPLVLMQFNAVVEFTNEEEGDGFSDEPLMEAVDFSRSSCIEIRDASLEEQSNRLLDLYREEVVRFRSEFSGGQNPQLESLEPVGNIFCFDNQN